MGTIVAIGGGEIKTGQTAAIDEYIVSLSGKPRPRLLFIPTASHDAGGYINTVSRVYRRLGCSFSTLLFYLDDPDDDTVRQKIAEADIIYVGGGNTAAMMDKWREKGVDRLLVDAFARGAVLCGLSAGSICWFSRGHSDSNAFTNPDGVWDYIKVSGLGLINAVHCPHYNEPGREGFDMMMSGESLPGIALENAVALCLRDGCFSIVKADSSARAFVLTNNNGIVEKNELPAGESPILNKILGGSPSATK